MNSGQMLHPVRGLVLHIMQGSMAGTDAEFHNPRTQKSAHFGTSRRIDKLVQWVDTNDKAWAIVNGNRSWIGIENEGMSGDSLTDSQIRNCAKVLAWLHRTDNVPLISTDDPNGHGLGWHGMGGAAWGGHSRCPGQPILDQRAAIIAAAQALIATDQADSAPENSAHHVF